MSLYISRVQIKNIRCFVELDLRFDLGGDTRPWTMIVGDNATGKTTLLKSIAIGLCDESSAAGLLRESEEGYTRRDPEGDVEIIVHLEDLDTPGEEYRVETQIERFLVQNGRSGDDYFERVRQKTFPEKDFPWGKIFACAYGADRGIIGTGDVARYTVINAVYNMYNNSEGLQNPELAIRRIKNENRQDEVLNMLKHLMLGHLGREEKYKVRLESSGIVVDGPWGGQMPLRDLADGYKATCIWLTDFLGWALSHQPDLKSLEEISGIVLIDEIEQHLHPSWQRSIIKELKMQFPNMQFITTTHAPMCVIGTTELLDEECKLVLLGIEGDHVEVVHEGGPPRGRRADQVLTSWLFGLHTSGDNATKADIEKYSKLLSKQKRAPEDEEELEKLRKRLDSELGTGETELERQVAEAVREVLQRKPEASDFDNQVLDYEIKRQLKELMS